MFLIGIRMQKRMPSQMINYIILETMHQEGTTYGYELIKKLKKISDDHWDPSYGTIYGALNRMEDKGLIERTDEGEDRKYYRLTSEGKENLDEREKEMEELGERAQDMVLGFLNVYQVIYGEEDFHKLIDRIKDEFDI